METKRGSSAPRSQGGARCIQAIVSLVQNICLQHQQQQPKETSYKEFFALTTPCAQQRLRVESRVLVHGFILSQAIQLTFQLKAKFSCL